MSKRKWRFFEALVRRQGTVRLQSVSRRRERLSHVMALSAAAYLSLGTQLRAEDAVPAAGSAPTEATPPAASPVTSNTPPATGMPEVVVTGEQMKSYKPEAVSSPKYTEPLLNIPQTVTVIPQAAITEQGATTLRDVLRNVPGISIQAGEGGVPAGDNLSVRGFSARTDIFIDNIRDFGGYSRDSFNIEQVEVSKGPSSTAGGRGSTGGTVNMVSKYAENYPTTQGTLGIGTDAFQRATFDVNRQIAGHEDMAFRLNGLWHSQEVANRDAVQAERWGLSPSFAFGIGTPTRVDLAYFHLSQDNVPDYGIPWVPGTNNALTAYRNSQPPVDYDNFYGILGRDYERTETDIGTGIVKHDFNENLSLRSILRFGQTTRDSIITAPRFVSDAGTAINRQLQSRDQKDTILANQTDVTAKFKTGPVEHAVVTGVDLSREKSVNFARAGTAAPTADLFDPNPNDPYTGLVTRTGARTEAEARSQGVYAFDTIKITPQVELTGGARWDAFNVDYVGISSTNVKSPLSRTDEMLSWRTGVVFKPVDQGSVYAAYGTSFNPSAEGLTLANTATATNSINTDPEKNRTVEVGTKWEVIKRKLLVSLALFRTEKTNARTEDPANPGDIIVLEGRQRVQGVEVGAAGNLTDSWSLFSGYTFMDSKVTSSNNPLEIGRPLSNTPKHSFSAWSTYQFPWHVDIGAGWQYVDARFNSTATPRKAPGYGLFDAMAAYHVNDKFTFRLNLYNLGDKKYIDRVGGGHFIPGAGRSAVVTSEIKF